MVKYAILLAAVTIFSATIATPSAHAGSNCSPLGYDKKTLLDLRQNKFVLDDETLTEQFALELIGCLGDPDSDLRDKVAFEGLSTFMRRESIGRQTIRTIGNELVEILYDPDSKGFRKPFAALVLSEVARADRLKEIYTDEERAILVTVATDYIRSITDYRGFDETDGWRHGVAHGADFLMQLSLNETLAHTQLIQIRDAVATQVSPQSSHFYIYGEGDRLARPILFIARRDILTEDEWTEWFDSLSSPAPFATWGDVFFSQAGLAKRHNIRTFALAIYANASASSQPELKALIPGALSILRATA